MAKSLVFVVEYIYIYIVNYCVLGKIEFLITIVAGKPTLTQNIRI